MKAEFTIPGPPRGKGRPRFRAFLDPRDPKQKKILTQTYSDKETVAYEELVKAKFREQCKGIRFEAGVMLEIQIDAYYKIPKSETKGNKTAMEVGYLRPTKVPDCDNVLKGIADALNKLAYKDDAQLVTCSVRKYYSHEPRVEVTILPVKNELKGGL